jgi:hypothetical protein
MVQLCSLYAIPHDSQWLLHCYVCGAFVARDLYNTVQYKTVELMTSCHGI